MLKRFQENYADEAGTKNNLSAGISREPLSAAEWTTMLKAFSPLNGTEFKTKTELFASKAFGKLANFPVARKNVTELVTGLAPIANLNAEALLTAYRTVPFWQRRIPSHEADSHATINTYSIYYQKFKVSLRDDKGMPLFKCITYCYIGEAHQNFDKCMAFLHSILKDTTLGKGFLFKCLNLCSQLFTSYANKTDKVPLKLMIKMCMKRLEDKSTNAIVAARVAICLGANIPLLSKQQTLKLSDLWDEALKNNTFGQVAKILKSKVSEANMERHIVFSLGGGIVLTKKDVNLDDLDADNAVVALWTERFRNDDMKAKADIKGKGTLVELPSS